ncbi:spermidine synthase [Abyssalbus ytuae]|uniref:Fused MFS/spermidine synthase n=1 Tax=Abyssalbus ytuae TaxID=2926907 RepID=A0A9E6ZTB7_9FLAO|nr:fused MFS/spermidine synthase [Abyssalbus ytuae]UOB16321.1 fused MFS/spermidine synthase [Abyssalbus ytuae]
MKKILSYVWPVTKHVVSKINGPLEITWYNGKKLLDSKNANYSYGNLQKTLSYGLSKINVIPETNILLLGMGGGSVIETIHKKINSDVRITAIEIDEVIIEIAMREFNVMAEKNLEIICADAYEYVKRCKHQFELIIIDVFIDTKVPSKFYSVEFWNNIENILQQNGTVLFNAGMNLKTTANIESITGYLGDRFNFEVFKDKTNINTLLLAKHTEKGS